MSVPLHRILPAASGQAVDARLLTQHIAEHPEVDELLVAWANAWYTRFDGKIEGRERAMRLVGGQVAALMALVAPLLDRARGALPEPAASLVFCDAVLAATAARLLAEVDRDVDPDVASLLALLRGMGPALALIDDADAQLRWWRDIRRARGSARTQATADLFGGDPACHVGTLALDHGALAPLAAAIADLDDPSPAPIFEPAMPLVRRAISLVHAIGAVDSGPALRDWVRGASLSEAGAWNLVDEALNTAPAVAELLRLPCRALPTRATLMGRQGVVQRVCEPDELELLALFQAQLIHHLRAHSTRVDIAMRERLRVDPITDLLTFQAFISDLRSALKDPADRPESLMIVDIQDFGERVAQDGLQDSDALLGRVATALRRLFPAQKLITRCGPATFLVAMGASGRRARFAADRVYDVLYPMTGVPRMALIEVQTRRGGNTPERLVERARRSLARGSQSRRRRVG